MQKKKKTLENEKMRMLHSRMSGCLLMLADFLGFFLLKLH